MNKELNDKLLSAIKLAEAGSFEVAIVELNQVLENTQNPVAQSYKAYCEAHIYGRVKEGLQTCQEMLKINYLNPAHHLIMGRILHMSNKRREAIDVLKKGLKIERNTLIMQELENMGIRKKPVFPSLDRDHPLNILSGKLLTKLRLR